jgi:hypothetical protein
MDQDRARALLAGERAWLQRLLRAETDQPRPLAYRPRVALRLGGTRALTRVAHAGPIQEPTLEKGATDELQQRSPPGADNP